MEKLREKTFYTIFSIISTFTLVIVIFINVESYQKEYSNIKMNLNKMYEVVDPIRRHDNKQDDHLDNKIIMDYNLYSFILDKDNNIIDMVSHNENDIDSKILDRVNNIITSNIDRDVRVGFLYFSNIAYNYRKGYFLLLVDTSNIRERLLLTLFTSVIILFIFEIVIFYLSKKIANWIIKPVEDSFNKQKDFIANASHELKTPLAVMIASIDCLEVNSKNKKYINNLKIESERMNNLITRLLDLSKSEKGLNEVDKTLNNLSKIIQKRILVFDDLAFENDVTLKGEIEDNIMFKCYPNDMDELIGILIDNAIKHSYKNSDVIVKLYMSNNDIVIEVINNGEVIPKEEYDKIFERFYRCDLSRERKSNRYGLGLSIAKNITNNYNGKISVSSLDNYTTFKVVFRK